MTRWTEKDLAALRSRRDLGQPHCRIDTSAPPFALPNNQAGAFGLGRQRRTPGTMNKTEIAYAAHLADRQVAKLILWFMFEPFKLKLAPSTFYSPDFLVMPADCRLEVHEVKGHWEDDARVKIKVAAQIFPFRFLAITRKAGRWIEEEFA